MVKQFDYSENAVNGYGILCAEHFDDDVIFNESYIIIGDLISDGVIHSCYNLTVFGNVSCKGITANSQLTIFGDIETNHIQVQKHIFCNGNINAKELNCYGNIYAKSINATQIFCGSKMIVDETINIDELCEVDSIMVACEGIIGCGSLKVKNAVANDYFDFDGTVEGKVLEIYAMENSVTTTNNLSLSSQESQNDFHAHEYPKLYEEIQKEILRCALIQEEEKLLDLLESVAIDKVSFTNICEQFKLMILYSYMHEINNIYDYLIIARADNELPSSLKSYDTIAGVFDVIFKNAKAKLKNLHFSVNTSVHFAEAVSIATRYKDYLAEDYEFIMDEIFSSIGIRFNTVKKVIREV